MSEDSAQTPRRAYALAFSLPEQIAERIADDILEDRCPPGTRLKEVELAAQFGVSRAPVREALRMLETQKLVRLTPQKGAVVVSLSLAELDELFVIRGALLGLSVRKITESGPSDAPQLIGARLDRIEALIARRETVTAIRELGELSQFAADLAGPGWIRDFLVITVRQTVKYSRRGLLRGDGPTQVVAGWRKVLSRVAARDATAAEQAARDLMRQVWKAARPTLESGRAAE